MQAQENPQALLASKFINNTNRNVFLTGKAGTGKTTFLRNIVKSTHKRTVVAAPTGIAAINAGGVTLHSLFQLPFGAFVPGTLNDFSSYQNININDRYSLMKGLQLSGSKRKLLQEMELLIIDEVSMLRADLLDAIDTVLRSVRRQYNNAFGGVQVLFIGDLLQLPPVVKENEWQVLRKYYSGVYFFNSKVLEEQKPLYIELEKIYRQADSTFINLLNNLRNNNVEQEDLELLNSYYKPEFQAGHDDNYINLTTHNNTADSINKLALEKLDECSFYFQALICDEFNEYSYPVDEILELKKGAQIMFIKNDPTGGQRFFNGKIGKVTNLSDDKIEVGFADNTPAVTVEKYEWKNIRYTVNPLTNQIEEKVIGTFTQYPVKLAWAITIHKSQGLTFSKAIIDLGKAFAPGQIYVALSRLTSLKGLVLKTQINYKALGLDESVSEFGQTKKRQEPLEPALEHEARLFLKEYIPQCFDLVEIKNLLTQHSISYSKDEQRSEKQKHIEWAVELKKDFEPVWETSQKFQNNLKIIFNSEEADMARLSERVIAAKNYFLPILKQFREKVLDHLKKVKEAKKVKIYSEELRELDTAFYYKQQVLNKAEALVNSVINNTELIKDETAIENENKKRLEETNNLNGSTKEKSKRKGSAPGKKEKINSKEESYKLYKQGKTILEIAKNAHLPLLLLKGIWRITFRLG